MQAPSGTSRGVRSRQRQPPRLLVDPAKLEFDDRTIVVRHTGDGGYVCFGFGAAGDLLDAVDSDPLLDKAIAARGPAPSSRAEDPFLTRLATAIALAKGYDPGEDRDAHGRWTDAGAAGAAAASTASAIADNRSLYGNSSVVAALKEIAGRVLNAASAALPEGASAVAAAAAPAAAFFGTLFLPTNGSVVSARSLPDAPEFAYKYDHDTGQLTVTRQNADGSSETVFSGHHGTDGVFRDENGNAIGRYLGDSVALDADAIRGYEARRKSDAAAQAGAVAQSIAIAQSEPKLCPDKTEESIAGRKPPALLYQSQISGLPPGVDFRLVDPKTGDAVSYDACWPEKRGDMGEAKGPNYFKFMIDPDHWYKWYQGVDQIEKQMARQSRAAIGREVEWHFAEQGPADYFRRYVEANRRDLPNIRVFYTPPIVQSLDSDSKR